MDEDRVITQERKEQFRRAMRENEKSRATMDKYMRDLEKLASYLDGRQLDQERLVAYKSHLQECGLYKLASINSFLAVANYFCRVMGWYDLKVRTIRMQKEAFREEERHLTRQEYQRLVQTAEREGSRRLALIIQTIGSTGIRVSELQYIDVACVYRGMANIRCKGKLRRILLPQSLQKLLKAYIKEQALEEGPVFQTAGGKPIDRSNVWREMKRLCSQAGIEENKVFPHNLRHLFAICFYQTDRDIVKLADILGHSNIETTRIYMKSTGEEHRRILDGMEMVLATT
ncbi:MAG: tyrosine-type recombinase/integrase [bacterium]|nr:tyrosine-type recombinase/integrase [bacterium]MCM1376308.1 tyrosine-type recombinase/integrase [Muribaculum sp.]